MSSVDTWKIEPTDPKAVTISGSFPLWRFPRDDTNKEDKGNDRLTSSLRAPVHNERWKRGQTTVKLYEMCICLRKQTTEGREETEIVDVCLWEIKKGEETERGTEENTREIQMVCCRLCVCRESENSTEFAMMQLLK